jgi:hypothetical protein
LLAIAGATLGCGSTSRLSTQADDVVAVVNGAPITRAQYDEYSLVFMDPQGDMRAEPGQIIEAVIAQKLVHEEIGALGLEVSEEDVDAHVTGLLQQTPDQAGINREGGVEALRHRVRSFLEFKTIKDRITADVRVSEEQVIAAYRADAVLQTADYDAVAPNLRQQMEREAVEQAWIRWLDRKRMCANVVVIEPSLVRLVASPSISCGSS